MPLEWQITFTLGSLAANTLSIAAIAPTGLPYVGTKHQEPLDHSQFALGK